MGFVQTYPKFYSYGAIAGLCLVPVEPILASEPLTSLSKCEQQSENASALPDRWSLANDVDRCLNDISDRHASDVSVDELREQLEAATVELEAIRETVDPVTLRLEQVEQQQFSTTTKLTGLAVLGAQYGDSIGDRPLLNPLTENPVTTSRPSSLGVSFLSFNTSFNGNDLLKTTVYSANFANDALSSAQLGNSKSTNFINTFFIPSRTVWSLIPERLTLYRLSYRFKPAPDLTLTVGPQFYPTDIIDRNSYTDPITTFNSWSQIGNSLITPYQMRLLGGAGAGLDWNIDGGPFSLRSVYLARRRTGLPGDAAEGNLFDDPHQATIEFEYQDKLSDRDHLKVQLQYSYSDTSNIEQNVVGINAELGLGKVGLFGRFGQSWSEADAGTNPLPFQTQEAGRFQTSLIQAGIAIKDVGIERSHLSFAVVQPFRTTLDPDPGIPKAFQTNLEAFYRIPLSNNLYLAPTLLTVINPNNRGDQPTLMQGFLRLTVLY